ncbi:MAG: 2-C-methyl-D-erythritol 2,4-cyclodiphosphate synthase [Fidelibacterota bacterium]
MRAGIGYDVHRLEKGVPLILGGTNIPHGKGAVGHSDGDVVSHAVADAVLGAANLGDIGTHFPSGDRRWKGISSLVFLTRVAEEVRRRGFGFVHVDCTVVLQEPRIEPHVGAMKTAMAGALGIDDRQISVKATTTDFLGVIGEGRGIAAVAVATLSLPGSSTQGPDHS